MPSGYLGFHGRAPMAGQPKSEIRERTPTSNAAVPLPSAIPGTINKSRYRDLPGDATICLLVSLPFSAGSGILWAVAIASWKEQNGEDISVYLPPTRRISGRYIAPWDVACLSLNLVHALPGKRGFE
ncbi:hypothetical protein KM043_002478 [Ampulex compressa]|nr:hypothetical protein KM043_002478 [Ampulex compressa]